ncbi:hypothetical protein [Paenibacillus thiaminolyticus]|uniref:hypothetical protein n=1 Tax=Paenibacillus thiaminolyticus TaxID=49283 RepID=UPI0025427158|nr:hypothetical protein [Paenibacillus thiaminolyticus]WII39871.1 hypothetical protein O0V01_12610 [Paenibacillus thiaminolyticus]
MTARRIHSFANKLLFGGRMAGLPIRNAVAAITAGAASDEAFHAEAALLRTAMASLSRWMAIRLRHHSADCPGEPSTILGEP